MDKEELITKLSSMDRKTRRMLIEMYQENINKGIEVDKNKELISLIEEYLDYETKESIREIERDFLSRRPVL